jgi:RNA polymerase sigma-70 factor (ECF subfamily)
VNDADAALLDSARAGDRAALDELLSKYERRIFRFGMSMCRDEEDAKDVAQETLVAFARGVGEFRGASSLSTWLFTVARRFCIKRRRKAKHAPTEMTTLAVDAERVPAAERLPDEVVADRELARALADAIATLDMKYREVLLLRDVEGLSAPEVAEVLGISVDAVKSRLHRARASVREQLAPRLSQPALPTPAAPCPDVLGVLSRKLDGDIDAASCAEMERHVASCPRCRDSCETLKRTLALCHAIPAGEVPSDVKAAIRDAIRGLGAPSFGS